MENPEKHKYKVIAITLTSITIIFIILVIVLPIIIENKIESDSKEKTTPHSDNTNLWAKFPGDLKTTLTHEFKILEYSENQIFNGSVKVKDSITLKEEVFYDNFNFTDKEDLITFDAKTKFFIDKKTKNEKINTLSLGMFETLETLSNPPLYQKGINSIQYLLNKAFPKIDVFIRQLFTYDLYTNLITDDDRIKATLLKNVDSAKADKILSTDEKYSEYSIKKMTGFYKWVKILNLDDKISDATWLKKLFELTDTEIQSVLGKNSYLNKYYVIYNKKLAYKYDCESKTACGNELLYNQLMSGQVINDLNLTGLCDLYQYVSPDYYPFSKSPEFLLYFEEVYKKKINNEDAQYEDYAPSIDQLNSMIDKSSYTSLLSANNSALFIELNKTDKVYRAYEIYTISANVMHFMADYLYDYLPSLFLYQEFSYNETEYTIDPIAKTYANLVQGTVDNTYGKLVHGSGLFNLILSKLVWVKLLNKVTIFNEKNSDESDELCPIIMQRALDDGKKVLKICSDPYIGFNTPYTLSKWFVPYPCIISGDESKCDMSVIDYLKNLVYITDNEIKEIYSSDFLGGAIEESSKAIKEAYGCEDECDNEYLSKLQFWKAEITKKLPAPLTPCDSIIELFPDEFPYPMEIPYYQKKLNDTETVLEEDVDYLINLMTKGESILSEESSDALEARVNLEKEITLYLNGVPIEKKSRKKLMDILLNGYLFENDLYTQYNNIESILQGNNDEDKKYVDFLSSGQYFENYKPKLNQTTGFNFGINLTTGEEKNKEFDRIGITCKQTDTSDVMRRIISINDFPILNIKKVEYNYLNDDYSVIESPNLDFENLLGEKSFIDGFQYEENDDEVIYYYDEISSRPFKFKYDDEIEYKDKLYCNKYILVKDDLSNGINDQYDKKSKKAFLSHKLNKPFLINVQNSDLNVKIEDDLSEENYICIDEMTNMVLQSNLNFIYSLYTRKYGIINEKIVNDAVVPVFTYNRNYEVDVDSYIENFHGVSGYYTFKLVFTIIMVILILICAGVALWSFWVLHKKLVVDDINNNLPSSNLINDSRDPTMHK